jgi:iron complex transport system substrate-binding protein
MTKTIEYTERGIKLPPRIVDDLTRREFLIGAGLIALAPACGSGGENGDASGQTRTFADSTGREVEVPVRAQRIVAVHDGHAAGNLLSLGAPVVGMPTRGGEPDPSLVRFFDLDGIEYVGEYSEPNIEQVAALQPDLIVDYAPDGAFVYEDDTVERLRRIAPVVGIDTFRPVEEVMADFAELLGGDAHDRLEKQEIEFDKALADLRGLLGERWREVTASFMISFSGELRTLAPGEIPVTDILDRLGVSWGPLVQEAARPEHNGYLGGISFERIPDFDADLLVTQLYDESVAESPLYEQLAAVQADQVVELPEWSGGTHYINYTATTRLIFDELSGRDLRTDLV